MENIHLVHQLVYLANEYPDREIHELGGMIQLSRLETDVATWRAQEL